MRSTIMLVLFSAAFLLGCDTGNESESDATTLSGTFLLDSIGGEELPVRVQVGEEFELWITGESITFERSGAFSTTTNVERVFIGEPISGDETGTGSYTRLEDDIRLQFDSGGSWETTLQNDTLSRSALCYLPAPVECARVYTR